MVSTYMMIPKRNNEWIWGNEIFAQTWTWPMMQVAIILTVPFYSPCPNARTHHRFIERGVVPSNVFPGSKKVHWHPVADPKWRNRIFRRTEKSLGTEVCSQRVVVEWRKRAKKARQVEWECIANEDPNLLKRANLKLIFFRLRHE